jgi:subtilisin family serine protease
MVRRTAAALAAATLGAIALPGAALAQQPDPAAVRDQLAAAPTLTVGPDGATATRHELIVRYEPGTTARQRGLARDRAGAELVDTLALSRTQVVEVSGSLDAAIARIERQPGVAYAIRNRIVRMRAAAPNDPRFGELWGIRNTGQEVTDEIGVTVRGTPGADVNALAAWDVTRGAGQVVAVVDTGVDLRHPDVAPNLWTNPGEIAGNGVDDDGNGLVDDVHGWDFVAPDADGDPVGDSDPDDYTDHGTHVAGTIAAAADNGIGVAGVAPEAKVMAVRVLDASGYGPTDAILNGILYAARNGADVVNLSLGGPLEDPAELQLWTDAIDEAGRAGAVVVAAAGNTSDDVDAVGDLPCSVRSANLVCVAALRATGELDTDYSSYGAQSVDLGAPGTGVVSSTPPMAATYSEDFDEDIIPGWFASGPWDVEQHGSLMYLSDSPGVKYLPGAESVAYADVDVAGSGTYGCSLSFGMRVDVAPSDVASVGLTDAPADTPGADLLTGVTLSGESTGRTTIPWGFSLEAFPGASAYPLAAVFDTDDGVEADGLQITRLRGTCRTGDRSAGPEYAVLSGTSMAAPHVSGAAALVRAAAPWATPAQVADALRAGTVPVASLAGKTVTGGRIDALKAIQAAPAKPADPVVTPDPGPGLLPGGDGTPRTTPKPRAACAGKRGKALAKCKVDQRVLKSCRAKKGRQKTLCAKRVRAVARCEALPHRTKKAKAKRAACFKKARAIGKPKAKAKPRAKSKR